MHHAPNLLFLPTFERSRVMFDLLSQEQEKRIDELARRVQVDADPGGSHDDAYLAIVRLYKRIGLKPPLVLWCDGPFQLVVMPILLQLIFHHPIDGAEKQLSGSADSINVRERQMELGRLLVNHRWRIALENLIQQLQPAWVEDFASDNDLQLTRDQLPYKHFAWSKCGIPTGESLRNLERNANTEAVKILYSTVSTDVAAELTSRLYSTPLARLQSAKQTVNQQLWFDHEITFSSWPTSATSSLSTRQLNQGTIEQAKELHVQIGGTMFEQFLRECALPPQEGQASLQKTFDVDDTVINTAQLLAFGPYDTLWGAWESVQSTCYAIIGDFLRDHFSKDVRSVLADLSKMFRAGFACTPATKTIFVCRFPKVSVDNLQRLHNNVGPAIEFPDGYKIFALNGTLTPREIIEVPETLTVDRIDSEINVELRRVLIERFGIANYLRESNAVIVDKTDKGVLYLKQLPDDEDIAIVQVRNSTREADGTYKEYFLRVPPDIRTVKEGVAWTFGLTAEEYNPKVET